MTNDFQMLWEDPSGSFLTLVVSGGGVEVHLWAYISGCSLILGCIEEAFAHLTSQVLWEKAKEEFITNNGCKISNEIIPMVVLVTDGGDERSLDMVTTFCCHDQVKMEPSEVFSI